MDCWCRLCLFGNSTTDSESCVPGGTVGPSYIYAVGTSFFPTNFLYSLFSSCLLPLFLLLISIVTVPMRKCSGEQSCTSSRLSIAILNGTCFFPCTETAVSSGNGSAVQINSKRNLSQQSYTVYCNIRYSHNDILMRLMEMDVILACVMPTVW